jgi:hypothetical protein
LLLPGAREEREEEAPPIAPLVDVAPLGASRTAADRLPLPTGCPDISGQPRVRSRSAFGQIRTAPRRSRSHNWQIGGWTT